MNLPAGDFEIIIFWFIPHVDLSYVIDRRTLHPRFLSPVSCALFPVSSFQFLCPVSGSSVLFPVFCVSLPAPSMTEKLIFPCSVSGFLRQPSGPLNDGKAHFSVFCFRFSAPAFRPPQ